MKPYAKKLLVMSAMAVGLFSSTTQFANAANNADVPVTAVTRNAIVVTKDTDMDFGQLDVLIGTQTGPVILNTDGTIDVTGTTSTVTASGGTPTAGQVTIQTDAASPIDVTCTAGSLDDGSGNALAITLLKISGTVGNTTAETDCTTSAAAVTPTAQDVVLKVGGRIVLGGGNLVVTGNKNYTTATGTAPNVSAAYQ